MNKLIISRAIDGGGTQTIVLSYTPNDKKSLCIFQEDVVEDILSGVDYTPLPPVNSMDEAVDIMCRCHDKGNIIVALLDKDKIQLWETK